MKKIYFALVFILLFISTSNSQLLWKISGNGLKKSSYLFGTHHLIAIQYLDSVPGLFKAFNTCEKVIGEISISNLDAGTKIQELSIMPNGIKIEDLLNKNQCEVIDKELKSVIKMGLNQVRTLNPTMILSIYEAELFKKTTGFTDNNQSDSYLQLIANEKGKIVEGLETVEEQLAILYKNGTLKRQAELLYEGILNKDSVLSEMKIITDFYKRGKIEELFKLTLGTGKKNDFTNEELDNILFSRNEKWISKIVVSIHTSPTFIAVGSAHLGGKKGIIKLLQKEGYIVTPIRK